MVGPLFDAAVLGGGPAGSATALALNRLGHSAVVIERSDYETDRIGETLPPAARKLLVDLGVWSQFIAEKHLPSFGVRSAWGHADLYENDFIFNPYGAGWHVDRRRFDALLAREAEKAGVIVRRRARMRSLREQAGGGWEFEVDSAGQRRQFRANFLVDATGRAPAIACRRGARRFVLDHLIGVIGFFSPGPRSISSDSFTLLESIEEGWWYSALLPDGRAVAAYMTDADLYSCGSRLTAGFWQLQLDRAVHTSDRLRAFKLESTPQVIAANSRVLDRSAGGTWLAVGDAGCSFDPLSSQGISKALESGLRAAGAIRDRLAGDQEAVPRHTLWVHEQFDNYMLMRRQFYRREMRWPRSTFWRRRHGEHREAASKNLGIAQGSIEL